MMDSLPRTAKKAMNAALVCTGMLLVSVAANAQQSMTVEELENFILKKKSELNETIEQRDETLDRNAELDLKRTEQAQRQNDLEQELRALCDEREAAEPGSLQSCLTELNIASN